MATIKAYTDLEQSKKLAEILQLDSADMHSEAKDISGDMVFIVVSGLGDKTKSNYGSPVWSLAALSEFILPYITDDDGNNYKFYLSKDGLDRWIAYYKCDDVSIYICEESNNMIDVIFEMICWLKENNKL